MLWIVIFLGALFTKNLLKQLPINISLELVKLLVDRERFNNHACSFTNSSPEKRTELRKFVWKLKGKGINTFNNFIN